MIDARTKRERAIDAAETIGENFEITELEWTTGVIERRFANLPEPAEVEAMREKIAKQAVDYDRLRSELSKAETARDRWKDAAEKGRLARETAGGMEMEIDELKERIGKLDVEVEALSKERYRLSSELAESRSAREALRTRRDELIDEVDALRSEIARKDEALERAIANLDESRDLTAADALRAALVPAAPKPEPTVNTMPLDLGAKPEQAHPACVAAALREVAALGLPNKSWHAMHDRAEEIEREGKL